MCRNIHTLHNFEPAATSDEVHAAALQYVRKIAGTTKPSKANQDAFDRAVHEIAHATQHLLDDLVAVKPRRRGRQGSCARRRVGALLGRLGQLAASVRPLPARPKLAEPREVRRIPACGCGGGAILRSWCGCAPAGPRAPVRG
jgi:hypothetical protein